MAKIIINLKTNWHFWFNKPKHRGLILDDIIRMLRYVLKNYNHVGRPKPEFTRHEVEKVIHWLLYKNKQNPFDSVMVSRTAKQRAWELINDYSRRKY